MFDKNFDSLTIRFLTIAKRKSLTLKRKDSDIDSLAEKCYWNLTKVRSKHALLAKNMVQNLTDFQLQQKE